MNNQDIAYSALRNPVFGILIYMSDPRSAFLGFSKNRGDLPIVIPNIAADFKESLFSSYASFSTLHGSGSNNVLFRLRKWLRDCDKNHNEVKNSPDCVPFSVDGRGIPIFVIDIEKCCLVAFHPSMPYITLSYCWGEIESAKTYRDNLELFLLEGSLLGDNAVVKTPRTVEDAMFLTGWLGIRYLWCDRLCIIQDDPAIKQDQFNQMGEIYARAYCTIIGYDGDSAESGLHGLPMLSGGHFGCAYDSERSQAWRSRGWTFQEDLFSLRKIKMRSTVITWSCGSLALEGSEWSSGSIIEGPQRRPADLDTNGTLIYPSNGDLHTGGLHHPGYPNFEYYFRLVFNYSYRDFSQAEDAIYALFGLESVIGSAYPGGFIQGMPVIHFDLSLLWEPRLSRLERRPLPSPSCKHRPASWSWVGWKGKVKWNEPFENTMPLEKISNVLPIVSWSTSAELDSPRRPVACSSEFFRWQNIAEYGPTPPGWSHTRTRTGRVKYTHEGVWEESYRQKKLIECAFPFPVITSTISTTPRTESDTGPANFLHGSVQTALFKVGQVAISPTFNYILADLVSFSSNKVVGLMKICEEIPKSGDIVQLIGISEGCFIIPRELFGAHYDEVPAYGDIKGEHKTVRRVDIDRTYYPGEVYHFYNVLWIDWEENGVAYRKASGRIAKRIWEAEPAGQIEITLA